MSPSFEDYQFNKFLFKQAIPCNETRGSCTPSSKKLSNPHRAALILRSCHVWMNCLAAGKISISVSSEIPGCSAEDLSCRFANTLGGNRCSAARWSSRYSWSWWTGHRARQPGARGFG
ncbi:hypothetical protein NPIL_78561 [Nephila pilipes]|uniref:Uncharacterized protein n=1 Tax=Nephila pilipes TaxID=299642 RepID=A0A8X6UF13_NEPPI|nr:hypothetical protein NPIL_78561 [Nephila pilipes]